MTTILLIVPPERFDFYRYLNSAENVEWILLWNEKPDQKTVQLEDLPIRFREIIYWKEFRTPGKLLKKIRPDRIVFFEIIDLRQIALIVTAAAKNIPTIFLAHGASGDRDTAILRWKEVTFKKHKLPYLVNRVKASFFDIISSKVFYYSVFRKFHTFSAYVKYFLLPFKMLKGAPAKVLAQNIFTERVPARSLIFNKATYDEYALYTGVPIEDVTLTGVPYFDDYFKKGPIVSNYVVYIDHPNLELQILEWTPEFHRQIAHALFDFAKRNELKLYIKLHPRSDRSRWESYNFDKNYVQIIQVGDFKDVYLESELILGYSSSLLTGFLCAQKNVVLLGWHPHPTIFGADLSKTGLCHVSFSPDDLSLKYGFWINHNLAVENENAYQAFLHKFNYPFDGKAAERVIKSITV